MKQLSRAGKLFKNTYMGMLLRIVNIFAQFILRTVIIKVLGDQYSGVSGLFTSVLSVLSLAELGIGSAITFALYRPIREKDYKKIAALMNFYQKAYRLVAVVVAVIGLCIIPFLDFIVTNVPDIKESIAQLYLIYLAQSVLSYFWIYKSVILNVSQKNYVIAKIDIVINITKTALEVLVLTVFHSFIAYIVFEAGITVLRNIIVSKRADKEISELKQYKAEVLNPEEKKKLWEDVAALALYSIATVILKSTDNIIISSMLGTGMITYVTNYKTIISAIDGFTWQFFGALNPGMGDYAVDHTKEQQKQMFFNMEFSSYIFSSVCFTIFVVTINPFIGDIWLGSRYVWGMEIVLVLAIDFYLNNMLRVVSAFRNANGLFIQGKYRPLFMAVLNVVLSVIMGKYIGVFGVLLATVISRVVTQLWFDPYIVFHHAFESSVWEYFKKNIFYAAVMAVNTLAAYAVCRACAGIWGKWSVIFYGLCGGAIAVLVTILVFGRSREFQYLLSKVKGKLR